MMDVDESLEEDTAVLDFSQQCQFAGRDGWLQGRYYGEEGRTVRELLSFDSVFEVCPFEVGVDRRAARRAFRARFARVVALMDVKTLLVRVFNTLSNGEMRRVLFARALLKGTKRLVLNDPMAGLDPVRREDFRRIIAAIRSEGVQVDVYSRLPDDSVDGEGDGPLAPKPSRSPSPARGLWDSGGTGRPVVTLRHIAVRFGRRVLFDDFSWTVRAGERWVLCGPNGSGKTLLMAMICGDSPLAYANDVTVFGIPRAPGRELARIRRRIAMVSPEMQTYSRTDPFALLEDALARRPALLILDEPCLNLGASDARRILGRVTAYLGRHPKTTAIVIAHHRDHIPRGFTLRVDLSRNVP